MCAGFFSKVSGLLYGCWYILSFYNCSIGSCTCSYGTVLCVLMMLYSIGSCTCSYGTVFYWFLYLFLWYCILLVLVRVLMVLYSIGSCMCSYGTVFYWFLYVFLWYCIILVLVRIRMVLYSIGFCTFLEYSTIRIRTRTNRIQYHKNTYKNQ
jgi:hypothetical protein